MASVLSEYITRRELAGELGVTERTLVKWAVMRKGPPTTKVGRRVLYRKATVAAWLAKHERWAA